MVGDLAEDKGAHAEALAEINQIQQLTNVPGRDGDGEFQTDVGAGTAKGVKVHHHASQRRRSPRFGCPSLDGAPLSSPPDKLSRR
jgi:hypothetical protein